MIYRLLINAFLCFICFIGTIELWGQKIKKGFDFCIAHSTLSLCMQPKIINIVWNLIALLKQCVMPLLFRFHHITWGKDWQMASVVLYFKVFMGPEWNDALDSHKLLLSLQFIGIPPRWCHSYAPRWLIQLITSCTLSWPFKVSLLPGVQKNHRLICVNVPGTGQFMCPLDCLVSTKFCISQLLLKLRKKQYSLNLMHSKWGKNEKSIWKILFI